MRFDFTLHSIKFVMHCGMIDIFCLFLITVFFCFQDFRSPFNRGAAKNIGALTAMKLIDFDCIFFHDVDLIPKRADNIYHCSRNPRHLSFTIQKKNQEVR